MRIEKEKTEEFLKIKNSIDQIDMGIPGTEKRAKINLAGKSLIITGANGSGKTRFLKYLYENIYSQVVSKAFEDEQKLLEVINQYTRWMEEETPAGRHYQSYKEEVERSESQLLQVKENLITLTNKNNFCEDYNGRRALVRLYKAVRNNDISYSGPVESLQSLKNNVQDLDQDSSNMFERYLITIRHLKNDILAEDGSTSESDDINSWFDKLTDDLKELFEDESLSLDYSRHEQCYYLKQDGKDKYRFSQLSSGYQSILNIYADLVTKVTLQDITPDKLSGIVFIDEIDAHLHVSLQRKILSFFTSSFPSIQFIITTHSPFVIQSVSDVVIYDISKNEQLDGLSMYSYESIVKGLLGVSTMSDSFNEKLDKLIFLVNKRPQDISKIETLIEEIAPYERSLDNKSRAFLLVAKNAVLDAKNMEEFE